MIKRLIVHNYALIDHLEIDFNQGFSVITGETGAGKSILLGALSMILGQRIETKAIKQSGVKCVVEGVFDVSMYNMTPFFEENELDYDATHCILRREVSPAGKSRAFINDTPVSLTQLKELGERLIDIHSQHQNLLLGNDKFQLQVVDVVAGNTELLATYRKAYIRYKTTLKELKQLQEGAAASREEEDYTRFQLNQLAELNLKEGEQESLESEQELLAHAEEIKGELYAATNCLNGGDEAVVSLLKQALTRLQNLTRLHPTVDEIVQRIHSNYIDLKDITNEVEREQDRVQVDPERLAQVEDRLNAIYQLQQKHRVLTIGDLLRLQEELTHRLDDIDHSDERIAQLQTQVQEQRHQAQLLADELTQQRGVSAQTLATTLEQKVKPLGMPNLRFEVELQPKGELDEMGAERVNFLFSANKNQPLQPVAEVASGGEISRLMLCIKAFIASAIALPTILFDEVDTGVSGDIADKMAGIMQEMSQYMQVMSITHLPQVASKGDTHYRVYKHDVADATHTQIDLLLPEQRVEEIARMLSGSEMTQAAIDNARVLLHK